jgi:hypothetical protein
VGLVVGFCAGCGCCPSACPLHLHLHQPSSAPTACLLTFPTPPPPSSTPPPPTATTTVQDTTCGVPSACYRSLDRRMEQYMNANRGRLGVPPSISFAACTDPPYTALFSDMVRSYDDLVGALLDNGGWGQGRVGQEPCESGCCCLPAPAVTGAGPLAPPAPVGCERLHCNWQHGVPVCLPGVCRGACLGLHWRR